MTPHQRKAHTPAPDVPRHGGQRTHHEQMTPERLARETGWDLDSWTRARRETPDHLWPATWRYIAGLAGATGYSPHVIAAALFNPKHGMPQTLLREVEARG